MNIFKELKKAPKVDIKEVNYGATIHQSDHARKNMSEARKTVTCARLEGKTVKEWAEHYGVSTQSMYNRISKYGSPHEVITQPLEIDGKTVKEWAEHYGVSESVIYSRLRRQNSPHVNEKFHRKTYKGKTMRQWAEHYGITMEAINYRMKKHGSPHPSQKSIQQKLDHQHYMSELHKDPTYRKKWQASCMRSKRSVQKQKNIELVMPYFDKHLAEYEAKTYSGHCEYSAGKIAECTGLPRHNVLIYLRELRDAHYSKVDTP